MGDYQMIIYTLALCLDIKQKETLRGLDICRSLNAIQLPKWICNLNLFPD